MLPLPDDTRRALGLPEMAESAARSTVCESRSLLFDRYANPRLKKEDRSEFFLAVAKRSARSEKVVLWRKLLLEVFRFPPDQLVFAQLQSRLMVNMGGGVMENAGLCLDRFGVPYIPGSAVKGCSRRMALHELAQAREAGKPVQELAELLCEIAVIFGWGDTDWKDGRVRRSDGRGRELYSDFEFAAGEGESWRAVRAMAAAALLDQLKVVKRSHPREPWRDLPNFGGLVSFLPAYPLDVAGAQLPLRPPALGALELDVVTCHHPGYYGGDKNKPVATDDEPPNPVEFPAVAAGHVFVFSARPLRDCKAEFVRRALRWLADGLAMFGIGAKTAAGYGWFDPSPKLQTAVLAYLNSRAAIERKEREERAEKERERQAEEARRRQRREFELATANMTEEEKLVYMFRQMTEQQFLAKLDRWAELSPAECSAVYTLMRGERSAVWLDLRNKAMNGEQKERVRWGRLVQDLFKIAKDRKEKMPS